MEYDLCWPTPPEHGLPQSVADMYNSIEENFFLADSLIYRYFHLPVITYSLQYCLKSHRIGKAQIFIPI